MSGASQLAGYLLRCRKPDRRALLYRAVEDTYGKNFADHLRDTVEAHHLIVENERAAQAASRARRQERR
jgi:hypothetical protein